MKVAVPVMSEPFIGASITVAVTLLVEVVASSVAAEVPSEEEADVVVSSSEEAPPPPVPAQLTRIKLPTRIKSTAIVGKTSFTLVLAPYPNNARKKHHTPWT
jgi:hypothetical protein